MFVPVLIIVIFNAKRTPQDLTEEHNEISDIDDYHDKAALITYEYNPNAYEIIFLTFYLLSLIYGPCILNVMSRV